MSNYEIVLRGEAGPAICNAFPELSVHVGDGRTELRGEIVDQAALHGFLDRVRNLGIDILELHRMNPEPPGRRQLTDHGSDA